MIVVLLLAEPSAVVFLSRFPTLSPLKSFPTRSLLKDSSDLPRLIRWDDYEELPQQENMAPLKSAVMVRKRQTRSPPPMLAISHSVLKMK